MEQILVSLYNNLCLALQDGWKWFSKLIDWVFDRFRNEETRLKNQINSFVLEFNALIPKRPGWAKFCDDLNVILLYYLSQLSTRREALQASLKRVSRAKRMLNKKPNPRVEADRIFMDKNLELLTERIVETNQLIRAALEFLNLMESQVIVHMDESKVPDSMHNLLADFLSEMKLTGLEDTGVRDDITQEIDGFKQERSN